MAATRLVGEREPARIEHLVRAEAGEERALLGGARGGEHGRAAPLGDLERGEADAAGPAVDEDGVALLQLAELDQRIVGGEERDGHAGGRRRAEVGRTLRDRRRRDGDVGGEAGGRERDHRVADGKVGHVGADSFDHTGAFHAERRAGEAVLQRLVRQEAERPHHVAEVQADGLDAQAHVACTEPGALCGAPDEVVDGAAVRDREGGHVAAARVGQRGRAVADGAAVIAGEDDLALGVELGELGAEANRRLAGLEALRHVDEAQRQVRELVDRDAAVGADGGSDRADLVGARHLRPEGDEGDVARFGPEAFEEAADLGEAGRQSGRVGLVDRDQAVALGH